MALSNRPDEHVSAYPRVPIEMDPCAVEEWMAEHSNWVLYLEEDMTGDALRALFVRYAGSLCPSEAVLSEIAAHPRTPPDVLSELSRYRWRRTHRSLGVNPTLPPDLLARLAHSSQLDVLEHVTWHPNTPMSELERLAQHARSKHARRWASEALLRRRAGSSQTPERPA